MSGPRAIVLALLSACADGSPGTVGPADAGASDAAVDAAGPDAQADAGVPTTGPDYDFVFDQTRSPTYHLVFEQSDWDALQREWGQDVPVTLETDGEVYERVGVHFKGNVSLARPNGRDPLGYERGGTRSTSTSPGCRIRPTRKATS